MSLFSPFQSIMQSLKGRQYRKFIKKCVPVVAQINELEKDLQSLSDDELRAKTAEFMERYQGEPLWMISCLRRLQ
jgi:preprotein translocase subunit SecA